MVMRRAWFVLLWCLASEDGAPLGAQTRQQELEERRKQEGGIYGDDELSKAEQAFDWVDDHKLLERFSRGIAGFGWYWAISCPIPASGLALSIFEMN